MIKITEQQAYDLHYLRNLVIQMNDEEPSKEIRTERLEMLNHITRNVYAHAGHTYYPFYFEYTDGPICNTCALYNYSKGGCYRKETFEKLNEMYIEKCYEEPEGAHGETMIWSLVED